MAAKNTIKLMLKKSYHGYYVIKIMLETIEDHWVTESQSA